MAVQPKLPAVAGGKNDGPMNGDGVSEKFDKPYSLEPMGIAEMPGTKNDIGEKSGFEADTASYIDKKGMCYGESAKLNLMPPGMDIEHQEYSDIRAMPFKQVTSESFPGDGWE